MSCLNEPELVATTESIEHHIQISVVGDPLQILLDTYKCLYHFALTEHYLPLTQTNIKTRLKYGNHSRTCAMICRILTLVSTLLRRNATQPIQQKVGCRKTHWSYRGFNNYKRKERTTSVSKEQTTQLSIQHKSKAIFNPVWSIEHFWCRNPETLCNVAESQLINIGLSSLSVFNFRR